MAHPSRDAVKPLAPVSRADARTPAPERLHPDDHLASLLSPDSFEADQYRVLRYFLEQARAEKGLSTIAVTSPAAGDGKTVTAVNLAATLARSKGVRVLLADTDLRRPFVAAKLGMQQTGPGLVGAVVDERLDLPAVVRPTPFRLDVLPAGPPAANAYEVVQSPRVGELLSSARAGYDFVVLDMPPMLLVPDCRVLSQWVDGFLVVVAAHHTPRKLLAETLDALEPAKVLGIVFNGDDRPLSGYYKRYYAGYHKKASSRRTHHRWPWQWRSRGPGRPETWR